MATYEELTAEQQDVLQTFINQLRSVAGEQARVNNHWEALNTMWSAQILAILAVLDDNAIPPNTSGLAGSQALDVDAEVATIRGHGNGILTTYNTSAIRELWTKAAGVENMIG